MTTTPVVTAQNATEEGDDVLDVVVIGAGLSGIGAAYRIREENPDARVAVLEAREELGGTWSQFRYPGIRSDSDMYTLAFPFEPWRNERAIAPGGEILDYLRQTADKHGITPLIRFEHRVLHADWSTDDALWTLTVSTPDGEQTIRTHFVYACSGYYSYSDPYRADIPGIDSFAGQVVHPQFWPENLDVRGKRVVVIGSGATAVTLLPSLAELGADATMLQRTPSYVLAQPGRDPLRRLLGRRVPPERLHRVLRTKNIALQWGSYQFARKAPGVTRRLLDTGVRASAGGAHRPSFVAPYAPWDQRLCLVPDGDLFKTLKSGGATIVTDTIASVEKDGIRTNSGAFLPADIIVTATGLQVEILGGAQMSIDGEAVDVADRLVYRGCMLEGVPNAALCVGYINASWGLRSDLSNRFVARMIAHLRRGGYASATPTPPPGLDRRPLLEMDSGYLQRAASIMPRRSSSTPWTMRQNYLQEAREMKSPDVTIDVEFAPARQGARA